MLPFFILTASFAKSPADGEKWDVNSPPGQAEFVDIEVEEGTWMSVDVSPDGSTIVFDLLGDIYSMPFGGGAAKALTSGMAWDMQPRFSPDGTEIAFTSDRGGGDNLWRMSAQGDELHPITTESFRLYNSPVWSPDGQYIVGRKHFTGGRSLGAGELWLVHRDGGGGLPLTKRANDQLDLGEPAFSPNGRYVYYSRDQSGGSYFQYNKDPNKAIYGIERLDRTTGDIESVTGGNGGAIRPTPSPDGHHLVFLRRNRGKTVMMIRDLRSGQERLLTEMMDHDMSETWAIHGVYPGMSWTPDGRNVVFWAKGGIHRIAIEGGAVVKIPFRISDKREIRKSLKLKTQVAPDVFDVKMARDVRVSPDGSKVAYTALGKIYVKALPDGVPKRLTSQNESFEFDPSWSMDSKTIVFATWNDQELGTIRTAPSGCLGWSTTLKLPKGHYREPALSSTDRQVTYRKVGGGWLRSPLWSQDQGIYIADRSGTNPKRIAKNGRMPVFDNSDKSVVYQAFEGGGLTLKRLSLESMETHTLAKSKKAVDIRYSSESDWLVFREKHQAHLVLLPKTGRTPAISPQYKSTPSVALSTDAGKNVHFSQSGTHVHWSLGDTLFSVRIKDAINAKELGSTLVQTPIGFQAKTELGVGVAAIVGAQIITMDNQRVIPDGTVVWENGRITALGPRAAVTVPKGARIFDGVGKSVLPGYIDVHHHGSQSDQGILPQQNWKNLSALAFGVTTVHDPSHDTEMIFSAAELQRAGLILSPRIYSTGTILYGADTRFTAHVNNLDDALKHLRRMKAQGATTVKSYNQPRRDQRQQLLEAGRQTDVMVLPEGGSLMMHNLTQIIDGHTGIEHAIPVAPLYEDVLQLWSGTQVGYTPTLGVAYGGLMGEHYWYANTNVWENKRLLAFAPRRIIDAASRRPTKVPPEEYAHIVVARSVKTLQDRGVSVQVGAHGQREGLAVHWEMQMFEQGGMRPADALRAATIDGARYIGIDDDVGSIAIGKLADLAVVDGNPLTNLKQAEAVRWTVLGGKVYEAMTMSEIFPNAKPLQPLYFQGQEGVMPTHSESSGCGCARH